MPDIKKENAPADDASATREFEIRNILVEHCGAKLTPDYIDKIVKQLTEAIERGPCAWAFRQTTNNQLN